jgi:polyhydroxyalkanoate synthase subunit PhaC
MTSTERQVPIPADDVVDGAEDVGSFRVSQLFGPSLRLAAHGGGAARAAMNFSREAVRIAAGRSDVEAAKGDWRFADPTWARNPGYKRIKQLYLAWSGELQRLVDDADVDWKTKERARFAFGILTSAVAPTNNLVGNPAALKEALETGGGSLVNGLRNFVSDARHNRGMPTQVDASTFHVGKNMAVTPGAVVYRDEVMEVIQYTPVTAQVRARPVVMVPPQINKYYFLDLAPGRSFIEYAVSRGIQFFGISWRNPRKEHGEWGLDTYAEAILQAFDVARDITGSEDVNALGMCAGGITMTTALSHLVATNDPRVHSASFGVTLLDFSIPAMVGLFQARPLMSMARRRSARAGVLDGDSLASVFTWMRPNDLVWNYWVNNYLMGKKPPAFDILAWNTDKTNLPGRLHGQFLDIFERNLLVKPAGLSVLGSPVNVSAIKYDTYITGGLTDHLTPWQGCYRATQLFSGPSTFVLSPTGHIQTQVSPPGNPKAHYFVGPEPGPDPEEWRAAAERREGTWWEHWAGWVGERGGAERRAPTRLGSRRHPVLDPAPGRYIHDPA